MPAIIVPIVSGTPNTATVPVANGETYFQIDVTAAVTVHFTWGNEAPHAKTVTVVFVQDGTGHIVTAGSEILVLGTVTSTASKTTVSQFFYDEVNQGWFAQGQGSTT